MQFKGEQNVARIDDIDKAKDMAIAGDERRTTIEEEKKDMDNKLERMQKMGWTINTKDSLEDQLKLQEEIASAEEDVAGIIYDIQHLKFMPSSQDLDTIKAILNKYKISK